MSKIAFTFPGQGSQSVGMGQDLAAAFPEARAVFDEVNEALGFSLSDIMFEGPDDKLRLTEFTQPALMASSMAVVRVLEARGFTVKDNAAYVAGHSLGEYAALCAAGTLSLFDTARLLQIRGQAMQQAVPVGQGAMAAILGLEFADVVAIAQEASQGEILDVANDNSPGQVVVSGALAAVERAIELAKAKGAKRALALPVSAPFHCRLMQPAAEAMAKAFADINVLAPCVPVIANVTALPETDATMIKSHLVNQVTGMVRWTETVSYLTTVGGVDTLLELGTGKVLTGLAKRINKEVSAQAIGSVADVEAFLATLG